jgi:hypothetical protein
MHGTSRNIIPEREILFKSDSLKNANCNHYLYLIKNYKINLEKGVGGLGGRLQFADFGWF